MEEFPNQPHINSTPKTYFWLFPNDSIALGPSRQHLRWWGEDKDGFVRGYLFTFIENVSIFPNPDTLSYTFVTNTDSTLRFPIKLLRQDFLVSIRAVDNTCNELSVGAVVKLWPEPYWDKNSNGIFDSPDIKLPSLASAMDPNPATQKFPIRNSLPEIDYYIDPVDETTIQQPETTFTVASFIWRGSDPDGDETISSYRMALNDSTFTTNSFVVNSTITFVTLIVPRSVSDAAGSAVSAQVWSGIYPRMRYLGDIDGLKLNSRNTFHVQSRDIAGEYSFRRIQFPQTGKTWYVKKPRGKLFVVNDYEKDDTLETRAFYQSQFTSVAGGKLANYDEINIRYGGTVSTFGTNVPKLFNPAFILTMKLFDYVFWYSDRFPRIQLAQTCLYYYTNSGGKVIYSTSFEEEYNDPGNTLRDFAPLDSVCSFRWDVGNMFPPQIIATRLWAGTTILPDSSDLSYPTLAVANTVLVTMRPIYKSSNARYLYHLEPRADRYIGMPNIMAIDNQKKFVFIGVPLHYLNGNPSATQGVSPFLNRIFVNEFGFQ